MTQQTEIPELLELFIEENDEAALSRALELIGGSRPDIPKLLDHLENFRGDFGRKRRAIAAIRKQLGLPLIPGAVCQRDI